MGAAGKPCQPPDSEEVRVDQRVEDIVVAASDRQVAPEERFQLILRREFDRNLGVAKLLVCGPLGPALELTDSRQLELLLRLGEQALPHLREAERSVSRDWRRWKDSLG